MHLAIHQSAADALSRRKTYPRLYSPHTVGTPQVSNQTTDYAIIRTVYFAVL